MEKTCTLCGQIKPTSEFYHTRGKPMPRCKPCHRDTIRQYQKKPPRHQTPPGTKRCMLCKETKPDSEFFRNKVFHDGLDRSCKACMGARSKAWHKAHPGYSAMKHREGRLKDPVRYKDYGRKRNYGLAPGEFDRLLAAQGGRCAICGSDHPNGRPGHTFAVDHDHTTGAVRGILCAKCNHGLGQFHDSKELLSKAIDYLSRIGPSC